MAAHSCTLIKCQPGPLRAHSAFAHLTGWGSDSEPGAVLVLDPVDAESATHEATLYFRPLAPRDSEEFFADSRYGEFWVGSRPTLESMAAELGIETRHVEQLGGYGRICCGLR